MEMVKKLFGVVIVVGLVILPLQSAFSQIATENLNIPAGYKWDGRQFTLEYNGTIIVKLTLGKGQEVDDFAVLTSDESNKVEQVFKWVSRKIPLEFTGFAMGSEESFPCEAEKGEDAPVMIRHCVGLSYSLLNRAVYDRKYDWLLSVDFPTTITISPLKNGGEKNEFAIILKGNDVLLRFRPSFYRSHRGLEYFTPWKYKIWDRSMAGWCSWFAYFDKITETDVRRAADILSDVLVPFGLEYLQIDDGYQQKPVGVPETWLVPNAKFPSGLADLSSYIQSKGMKPGIWTNVSFHQKDYAEAHQELFVRDEKGKAVYGNWIGYVMDGNNSQTLDELVKPVYRKLKEIGWQYYKVDALRHLRYEGYNSNAEYYQRKGIDVGIPYRTFVWSIREEIGDENFMMGCWGIRPELIGIIDACRIGDDGFGYGGLAEYNSFNNVVWRNDPDHIELTPGDAYKSCMTTSLTGSVFMLTDKPEVYRTAIVEPAKRSLPILFTRPGQVYDVDPARSALINRVKTELSGAGPRAVDADQREYCHLYLLEIVKPFDRWIVLGRTGGGEEKIGFRELGLDPEQEYHVFEFWSKRYLGSFHEEFHFGTINADYGCQLFCIRPKYRHPQVLATNRHISCGGYDLENVEWNNRTLSGKSNVVKGDIYEVYVFEPQGFAMKDISVMGAKVIENVESDGVRKVTIQPGESAAVSWQIVY